MVNITLENSTYLWRYGIWYTYFNIGLVKNLGHINVFLKLWAQLFQKSLGTGQLAKKLQGTLVPTRLSPNKQCIINSMCLCKYSSIVFFVIIYTKSDQRKKKILSHGYL